MIASDERVFDALLEAGIPPDVIHLRDSSYAFIAPEGVRDLGRRFLDFLRRAGIEHWIEDTNDCDDFALHAHSFAKLDHARYYAGEDGLAFGEASVMCGASAHALNIILHVDADAQLTVHLCEPQIQPNDRAELGRLDITLRPVPLSAVSLWRRVSL